MTDEAPPLTWWSDDPRTAEMARAFRVSATSMPASLMAEIAVNVARRWGPELLPALPLAVLPQELGRLEQRVDALSEALAELTSSALSPPGTVAGRAEEVAVALREQGVSHLTIAQEASTWDLAKRRRLAVALGMALAAFADTPADIPVLGLALVGRGAVFATVTEMLADAISVALQALAAAAGSPSQG